MGTENNRGIGGCDLLVNHNDVVSGAIPMSPWKTSAVASPVTGVDSESWPSLLDAQRSKSNGSIDLKSTKSLPPPPAKAKADGTAPPPATPKQVEPKKFHGRPNTKPPHRPYFVHQNKTGPKHVPYNVPPFSGSFPYQSPVPYFLPASAAEYAYPFPPGYFNYHLPQNMGPRPRFSGPNFPGQLGNMYYYHVTPPGSVIASSSQFLAPSPPGVSRSPSPTKTLRDSIVMQIEYYFSDKNLQYDHYLKSLMDNQGWVSISIISNFQMVKRMNVDIPFILDALKASETIEVKGEKVRRRHEWSKWVSNTISESLSPVRINNNPDHDESKRDCSEGKLELPSPNGCPEGLLQVEDLSSDEAPKAVVENIKASMSLGFQLDDGNDCSSALNNESNCKSTTLEHCENRSPIVKNHDESAKEFSSTFVRDENLEMEQTNKHSSMEMYYSRSLYV